MLYKNNKHRHLTAFLLLPILLYGGYLGAWCVCKAKTEGAKFLTEFNHVLNKPFGLYFCRYTWIGIAFGLLVFGLIYLYEDTKPDNFRRGIEHGSARWGDARKLTKRLADKAAERNRILSEHVRISFNTRKTGINNNVFLVGGSGMGKTTGIIYPNVFRDFGSMIVTDPKGEIFRTTAALKARQGYDVRVLNLIDMDQSMGFNPLVYCRTTEDVVRLMDNFFDNTESKKMQKTGDQVWDNSAKTFLTALALYVFEKPEEPKNFHRIWELMNKAKVEQNKDGSVSMRELSRMFDTLPDDSLAKIEYMRLLGVAGDTLKSVLFSVYARMSKMDSEALRQLFMEDELHLADLGTGVDGDTSRKVILYCIIPDNNDTYNFVVGMMYTQLFQELYFQADHIFGGPLPVSVSILMDEFANVALPDSYTKIESTIRSRNIDVMMMLQNMAQIKALFKDDWETVTGNASAFVYLGGNEQSTYEYVSKLLGHETVDKNSDSQNFGQHGGSSRSHDTIDRSLLYDFEIRSLPRTKCIILIAGEDPVVDDKYRVFNKSDFIAASKLRPYELPSKEERQNDKSGALGELSPSGLGYCERLSGNRLSSVDMISVDAADLFEYEETDGRAFLSLARQKERMTGDQTKQKKQEKQSVGNAKDVLNALINIDLNPEQKTAVIEAYNAGMTDQDILDYLMKPFVLPAEQMRKRIETWKML